MCVDRVEAAVDAALESETPGLMYNSLYFYGSGGCIGSGRAAEPMLRCGGVAAAPTKTDVYDPTALQQMISCVMRGQRGDTSAPWLRVRADRAQAGCAKPGHASQNIGSAQGSPAPDVAACSIQPSSYGMPKGAVPG